MQTHVTPSSIMPRRRTSKGRSSAKFSNAIRVLRKMKPSQRSVAIRTANDKFIRDIVSHVRKLRSKKLPPQFQKTVKRYSTHLRSVCSPKVSLTRKRKILSQKGGFLPALLPILAPLAATVLGPIVGKIFGN